MEQQVVHVIHLSGQGDTHVKVVTPETYQYVTQGWPIPQAQVEALEEDYKDEGGSLQNLHDASSHGSRNNDNDRALMVRGDVFNGEQYDQYGSSSTAELLAFLKRHCLTVSEDDYDGYIY